MARLAAGTVAIVRFPFSDLSNSKRRPAVVLADAGRDDFVLCQVTSNPYADPRAIQVTVESFSSGGLPRTSYVRPGKLFTANRDLVVGAAGQLNQEAHIAVIEAVVELLRSGSGDAGSLE